MNDANQQGSGAVPPPPPNTGGSSSSGGSSPPVANPVYQSPPPQRRGLLGTLTKLGGLISFAALIFLVGFYTGLFSMAGGGPIVEDTWREGEGENRIAVIPVTGMIIGDDVWYYRKTVQTVIDDPSIKAVVLRVESPGGSATASDQIWDQLQRLKTQRDLPIIASFGGVAASGGYYVAAAADEIFAEPTTITGSIGVLATAFTMEELLTEKLGVQPEIVHSTPATEKGTANNIFRSWTPKDRELMRHLLDSMHEQFVRVVISGRNRVLDEQKIRELANGRVFTADEASEMKLVDEIGYIEEAIDRARQSAGISRPNPPIVTYRQRVGIVNQILQVRGPSLYETMAKPTGYDPAAVRRLVHEMAQTQVMYLYQP